MLGFNYRKLDSQRRKAKFGWIKAPPAAVPTFNINVLGLKGRRAKSVLKLARPVIARRHAYIEQVLSPAKPFNINAIKLKTRRRVQRIKKVIRAIFNRGYFFTGSTFVPPVSSGKRWLQVKLRSTKKRGF